MKYEQTIEIFVKDIEEKISYHSNGNLEYKSIYKNNNLHGVTKYWDESGNLISEATYSNGELHGLWISYYNGGNIKSKI